MKKIWNEYKNITLKIIKSIEEDKEDVQLFDNRENVIENLLNSNLSKEELKLSYEEENINELDKKLEYVLKNKMQDVKEEIKKVKVSHQANKLYSNINSNKYFFSTKV
ncbi:MULTISPECIES: flagellar protein FliT [Clostridium]|uniref:flagellar protein FliT n=1 Tax=Clostridium TaxID=1485 RepID=UPI002103841F|nr:MULTISPECIES: flagellar protein FliT [Clostridium]MBS4840284.1 flagellar protein FliT [Clostridium sp.]MCQ2014199.1 flagellar protein FliT [Clostridium butyricum]MCQ2018566.1 flagellar protein FliT [Clostridium butyricum]MCQ2026289.1 flagellar protein FliT [Clostridium butyricum]MDU1401672.1 flagellar protein FliT [Clostridium sp.]